MRTCVCMRYSELSATCDDCLNDRQTVSCSDLVCASVCQYSAFSKKCRIRTCAHTTLNNTNAEIFMQMTFV